MPSHVILDNASLMLGASPTVADLKELACYTNHLELTPDVSVTTLETMCGAYDYPGVVKWALIATLFQSFDTPDGTEEVLSALVDAGVPCYFVIAADRMAPISAANPGWQGEVTPQDYSPLNGDAGAGSEISLEWALVGKPTKITVPPVATIAELSGEEAEAAQAAIEAQKTKSK
jgi:hypothetical protein